MTITIILLSMVYFLFGFVIATVALSVGLLQESDKGGILATMFFWPVSLFIFMFIVVIGAAVELSRKAQRELGYKRK